MELDLLEKILNHSGAVAVLLIGLIALKIVVPILNEHLESLRELVTYLAGKQDSILANITAVGDRVDNKHVEVVSHLLTTQEKLAKIDATVDSIYEKAKTVCRKMDADRRQSNGD
jgi:predicted  nucleic acid-binding Zn-ribbon protein